MKKAFVVLQIAVVVALIAFSTIRLFQGDLAGAMSICPLILVFYFFVALNKR